MREQSTKPERGTKRRTGAKHTSERAEQCFTKLDKGTEMVDKMEDTGGVVHKVQDVLQVNGSKEWFSKRREIGLERETPL